MHGERRKSPPTPCEHCGHPIDRNSDVCKKCAKSGKYKLYEALRNAIYSKNKRDKEIAEIAYAERTKAYKEYIKDKKGGSHGGK